MAVEKAAANNCHLICEKPIALTVNDANAMIADFLAAVREGRQPAATGHDGARALAVGLGAYESAASGQPVRLG